MKRNIGFILLLVLVLLLCSCESAAIESGDIVVSRPNDQVESKTESVDSSSDVDTVSEDAAVSSDLTSDTVISSHTPTATPAATPAAKKEPIIVTHNGQQYSLERIDGDGYYIGANKDELEYERITNDGVQVDTFGYLAIEQRKKTGGIMYPFPSESGMPGIMLGNIMKIQIVPDSEIADVYSSEYNDKTDQACTKVTEHVDEDTVVGSGKYSAKHYRIQVYGETFTTTYLNGEKTNFLMFDRRQIIERYYIDIGDNRNIMAELRYCLGKFDNGVNYGEWFDTILGTLTLT